MKWTTEFSALLSGYEAVMSLVVENQYSEYPVFAPFTEKGSFLLRLTLGCAYNKCRFCKMYRQVQFKILTDAEIMEQIERAKQLDPNIKKVFLADGDALVLTTEKLLKIFSALHETFPRLESITSFAAPKDILGKSLDELQQLHAAGLTLVYYGFESGADDILQMIDKGVTAAETENACKKVKKSGIGLHLIMMLGIGGQHYSQQNALCSADIINSVGPDAVSAIPLMLIKGTDITDAFLQGKFEPLTPGQMLQEASIMVQNIAPYDGGRIFVQGLNFFSNYIYFRGTLPNSRDRILEEISQLQMFLSENNLHDVYHNFVQW